LIGSIFLQTSEGIAVFAAIIIAIIVSSIFFAIQRRSVSSIKQKLNNLQTIDPKIQYDVDRIQNDLQNVSTNLNNLRTTIPHTNEVAQMQENVTKLCADFTTLKTTIEDQINVFRHNTTEDLNNTKEQMIKTASDKISEFATNHIIENSVTREEFDGLKLRIEKLVGADEATERMNILSSIFESVQIKVLNWQCALIKSLRGGLAPEAEEEALVSAGIPLSSYEKFLKKLIENGIVQSRRVEAYYLNPDFEWIYSYIDNPDWLRGRLENTIKKERDYQQFVQNNLHLIEDGLLLEESEYQLATGKIDFICRDKSGRAVGLELKYPYAITEVKGQLLRYRVDYEKKTGMNNSRFILVSPKISDKLKEILEVDNFEHKEIPFQTG
jgi:hypothetical protein